MTDVLHLFVVIYCYFNYIYIIFIIFYMLFVFLLLMRLNPDGRLFYIFAQWSKWNQ